MEHFDSKAMRILCRALRSTLRNDYGNAEGVMHGRNKEIIEADPRLKAYFDSVRLAAAWADERARVGQHVVKGDGYLSDNALAECVPIWQTLGQMLIDAGAGKASAGSPSAGGDGGAEAATTVRPDPDAPHPLDGESDDQPTAPAFC